MNRHKNLSHDSEKALGECPISNSCLSGIEKQIKETSSGIGKIEAHLSHYLFNYDKESIAFSHLSAIEHEVGTTKPDTHNEIWVITNDFEENNDSNEVQELREAILSNLSTNVDYYYLVTESHEEEMKILAKKLSTDKAGRRIIGTFNYFVNNSFDFIPTPYYDIILYIKYGPNNDYIESSSKFYYCFSRTPNDNIYFYQKVQEKEVWNRLTNYVKKYKEEHKDQQKTMVL